MITATSLPATDHRPDGRLVPAAMLLWSGTAAGLLIAWWWTVILGSVATLTGLVILARRTDRSRAVAWTLLVCGPVLAVVLGIRLQAAAAHPLRAEARQARPVTVRVVLVDRPKPVFSAGFGGRPSGVRAVVVHAEVVDASVAGRSVATDGPVLLVAPAAGWAELLPGQSVLAAGDLAVAGPGELTAAVVKVRGPPDDVGPAPSWQRAAEELRAGLRKAAAVLPADQAGLLPALVDGDTGGVPRRTADEFRVAGMTHLLAVSGANLAILCGAMLLALRALRVGPRTSAAAAGVTVVGFVLLAGPEPSVLRAAMMGGVALFALAGGRERAALPALACAVILLVLHDPGMATEIGFALSVLATGALVVLAPTWARAMAARGFPLRIAQALAIPLAAHLVTAPVVAGFSGQVSVVAVLANVLAEPMVAPATVLGIGAALVSPVSGGLAELLARLAGPEIGWLTVVAREAAELPWASVSWPAGWLGGLLLLAVTAGIWVALRSRRLRTLLVAACAVLLMIIVPVSVVRPSWPPPAWAVVACDVGQGDAVVLATAEADRAVVVDTGPEPGVLAGCLRRLGVTRVSLVVLSHLHADHVGGLAGVLADLTVGAVAVGPARFPSWAWDSVRRDTAAAGVPLLEMTAGQRLSWPGLDLDVLGPDPVDATVASGEPTGTEVNNASVVLRASTSAGRVLLTGDMELEAQARLLTSKVDLTAEILKVPHHGSRYSLPQFLAAVHSRVALVSVGAGNRYGHPSPVTTGWLTDHGAWVLRTDEGGDTAIVAAADGPAVVRRGDPRPPPHKARAAAAVPPGAIPATQRGPPRPTAEPSRAGRPGPRWRPASSGRHR